MTYALSANVRAALRDSDRRIVVTGAGGWVGLATLELLSEALGSKFDGRVVCYGASRKTLALLEGRRIQQFPLGHIAHLSPRPSVALHLAFLTKDRAETMDEADYTRANRALTQALLGALDGIDARAVFVASSGAARFADDPAHAPAMRLYGTLKRADEEALGDWAETRGRRAVIARLFNIAGPHINKVQSYALSALILDALAGGPVRVRAPHRVVRGYVAIRELMSLVFALLLDEGPAVVRFDTGGKAMELAEVAAVVAEEFGGAVDRPAPQIANEDIYLGNPQPYARLLVEHGIEPVLFADQVRETGDYLQQYIRHGPNIALAG